MKMIKDNIYLFKSNMEDLSSYVFITKIDNKYFQIEVGSNSDILKEVSNFIESSHIKIDSLIITHFHQDHFRNIDKYNLDNVKLYLSTTTKKKFNKEMVTYNTYSDDAYEIKEIKNSHSKDALVLIDKINKTIFIGDLLAPGIKKDYTYYYKSQMSDVIALYKKYSTYHYIGSHEDYDLNSDFKELVNMLISKKEDFIKNDGGM